MKEAEELKELFIELKNTSELMIDLAYSALIFNSKELAEEVKRLEKHIDDTHTKFELLALSIQRAPEESEEFLSLITLSQAVERISDAAFEIASIVLKGIEPHPIFPLVLEEAEETITKVEVSSDSILVGKTISEIRDKMGQAIIAIYTQGKWIYNPRKDISILPNDILIARGYAETKEKLEKLARVEVKEF